MGLYEKALPLDWSFEKKLITAAEIGYDFLKMSIDPSPGRLSRLEWKKREISETVAAQKNTGMRIRTLALSANRCWPLGEANDKLRARGVEILKRGTDLCAEIGAELLQIAAYDVFPGPGDEVTRRYFIESLHECARYAKGTGVLLTIETMDTPFIDCVQKAEAVVREVGADNLKIYADVGNITAMGYDFKQDIETGFADVAAIHLKDAVCGCIRRIGYGAGIVDFAAALKTLRELGYGGLFVAEMWGDDDPAYVRTAAEALCFLAMQAS